MKPVTLKQKLINKLAKREHTAYELIEWCAARGFDRSEASASVLALKEADCSKIGVFWYIGEHRNARLWSIPTKS